MRNNCIQVVIVLIDNRFFAVESGVFQEVVQTAFVTPLPFVPPYVEGLVNIDGRIATQIDLGRALSGKVMPSPGTELAFVSTGRSLCALRVQQVISIIDLATAEISYFDKSNSDQQKNEPHNNPDVKINAGCISGEFVHDGKNVLLLDHREIGLLIQAREIAEGKGGITGKSTVREIKSASTVNHHLIVLAGGERYGFPIDRIIEIFKSAECTPIPGAPDLVAGLTLVRGQPVITVTLQGLLNSTKASAIAPGKWTVLAEYDSLLFGMTLDEIISIEMYEGDQITPIDNPESTVQGVVENSQGMLTMLVEPSGLLTTETLAVLKRFAPVNRNNKMIDQGELRSCLSVLIRDELYAIPLDFVNRVLQYKPFESLSDDNSIILGAIDVEGRVVPVIDVHAADSGADEAWSEYVIVENEKSEYAIRVTKTHSVFNLPLKNISEAKTTGNVFVDGVAHFDGHLYSLFNNKHLSDFRQLPCG